MEFVGELMKNIIGLSCIPNLQRKGIHCVCLGGGCYPCLVETQCIASLRVVGVKRVVWEPLQCNGFTDNRNNRYTICTDYLSRRKRLSLILGCHLRFHF